MIKHGEGRYMDPEGGFFTFGLTNRTAIILVEFEGDPAAPCVEKEIRLCLTRPEARPRKPGEIPEILPHYASDQPGALTLWLDANRFFRRLPMGAATRTRYDQMRPAMEFELLLALEAVGNDSLSIAASYTLSIRSFRRRRHPRPRQTDGQAGGPEGTGPRLEAHESLRRHAGLRLAHRADARRSRRR